MQRDFGSKNFNHAPVQGYNAQPRYFTEENPYENVATQSLRWARQQRDEYSDDSVDYESRVNIQTLERPALGNTDLPIAPYKEIIGQTVDDNRITIVTADTGGGKSTQIPQFLYERGYYVIQTQPRRIAASSVADRIGEEIFNRWQDTPRDVSAYHTAEKNTKTENTRIVNVTDGLLYAQDTYGRQRVEKEVVIIDEVHEWGMDTEMELALIRNLIVEHPEMRFVLQSATMDTAKLQKYYAEVLGELPPVIEVPGRTFGVKKQEFPESTSVQRATIRAIEMYELAQKQKAMTADGYEGELLPTDFIVTCPGKREIKDWMDEVQAALPKHIAESSTFLPLHSKMSDKAQQQAFRTDFPGLKIIFATNAAKTSLTIPGIGGVVDCGYARHMEMDENGILCLALYPSSRADCMQWAGRAGRIAPGWYDATRPSSDIPYVAMDERDEYEVPEAQRTNPDRYVLRNAAGGTDFATLKFMHTIDQAVIERSKESLRILGALDDDGKITTIGKRMNEFPIQASSARMMIEADQYSPEVRSYMAAIVSSHEAGGLQLFAHDVGRRWKSLTEEQESDLLAQLDIFIAMQGKSMYEQQKFDLDVKNMQRARETYWKVARKSDAQLGVVLPPTQEERELIKRCIYAGMPENVYQYSGDRTYKGVSKDREIPRTISNRSVVTGKHAFAIGSPYRTEKYIKGNRTEKPILETVTVVKDISVLGKVALSQCEWQPTGEVKWRDGKPVQIKRQVYNEMDLGVREEAAAEPSASIRQEVIKYAVEHPGSAQQELRGIKKELERLQHLTNIKLTQLTQMDLEKFISAAAPVDILDPALIDNNLRMMNVTLDAFISSQQRQEIIDNAPTEINVQGMQFGVAYKSGQPTIRHFNRADVVLLNGNIYLDDGRQVMFVHERKQYTAMQIRALLG
ncbi:MAG TPA: DEAD/DEAH box helicase [Candidatus Saccharimonadales bacterium]|nr:DEAD/DEAH box helicase [Candidatus Saccharimonadales bacterium]